MNVTLKRSFSSDCKFVNQGCSNELFYSEIILTFWNSTDLFARCQGNFPSWWNSLKFDFEKSSNIYFMAYNLSSEKTVNGTSFQWNIQQIIATFYSVFADQ